MTARSLIVNADDFGQTSGINRGIIRAHEEGIVTSASLMVRWPAARQAVEMAQEHPRLSLGLHIDLGEWAFDGAGWTPLYTVVADDDPAAVELELQWQVARFQELTGRDPTHLDSHQHVHREAPLCDLVRALGDDLGVPVRGRSSQVAYSGAFYGMTGKGAPYPEGITVAALLDVIETLTEDVTELGCHPGEDDETDLVYRGERVRELAVLCDPQVAAAIGRAGVRLTSFDEIL